MLCADPRRFLKEARCWGFAHSTSDVPGGCLSPPSWYPCHSHPSPPPRPFQYIPPKATDLGKQGPPHFPAQLPLRSSAAHARGHAIMHILPYLFIKKPKQNPRSLEHTPFPRLLCKTSSWSHGRHPCDIRAAAHRSGSRNLRGILRPTPPRYARSSSPSSYV